MLIGRAGGNVCFGLLICFEASVRVEGIGVEIRFTVEDPRSVII